jgi:hypothetical protein
LKWDKANESKGKHSKLQNLWLKYFQVAEKIKARTYQLKKYEGGFRHPPGECPGLEKILLLKKNVSFDALFEFLFLFSIHFD